MATRFYCDRCAEEMKIKQRVEVLVNTGKRNAMDLCERCIGDLHEFFKPLPKAAEGMTVDAP